MFQRWGRVIDIFIPQKRNKFGNKFGFVKFIDVNNPKAFEEKLDALWLGTYKLRVNIPVFDRVAGLGVIKKPQAFVEGKNNVNTHLVGKSYAQALVGGATMEHSRRNVAGTSKVFNRRPTNRRNHFSGPEFTVFEGEMEWLKGCFVGKSVDPEGILCIKKKIVLESILAVNLTPLGGDLVLMFAPEGENFEEILRKNEKNFICWFAEIRPWSTNLVARERSVWIKVLGVPAHFRGENFFKQISLIAGKYIIIDDSTRDRARLDIGRVLIITAAPDIINRVVEVKINGTMHSIRLLEESFGDNFNKLLSDWKYQNSEDASTDDEDSAINNILMVPETELTAWVRDEDIKRLHKEFSNQDFDRCASQSEKTSSSCKICTGECVAQDMYEQLTSPKENVQSQHKEGLECVGGIESAFQKAGAILGSPSTLLEDLGRCGSHVKFIDNLMMGPVGNNLVERPNGRDMENSPIIFGSPPAHLQRGRRSSLRSDQRIGPLDFGLDDISCSVEGLIEKDIRKDATLAKSNVSIKKRNPQEIGGNIDLKRDHGDAHITEHIGRSKTMSLKAIIPQPAKKGSLWGTAGKQDKLGGTKLEAVKGKGAGKNRETLRKASISAGKKPMVDKTPTPEPTQVSDPISGSLFSSNTQIKNKNRAIIRVEAYREANEIWGMGKQIGMVSSQNDEEGIEQLVEMVVRDRYQCDKVQLGNDKAGTNKVS